MRNERLSGGKLKSQGTMRVFEKPSQCEKLFNSHATIELAFVLSTRIFFMTFTNLINDAQLPGTDSEGCNDRNPRLIYDFF